MSCTVRNVLSQKTSAEVLLFHYRTYMSYVVFFMSVSDKEVLHVENISCNLQYMQATVIVSSENTLFDNKCVAWHKAPSVAAMISSLWLRDNRPIWLRAAGDQGKQTQSTDS